MTERNVKYILGGAPHFPSLHLKVSKGNGRFLYCFTLYVLGGNNEFIELCHCDNYHEKGHHIHIPSSDGSFAEKPFDFKSLGETTEYFKNNWEDFLK